MVSSQLRKRDPIPSWQTLLLIGWTGMRGVVSLAAALALPQVTNNGTPFPNRHLILFLTFCVILVTLVLQGLTLPLLLRWLKVVDDVSIEREEMEGRLRTAQAAMAHLEEITAQNSVLAEEMVEWLRTQYEYRIRHLSTCCGAIDAGSYEQVTAFQSLKREVIATERRTVIKLRNQGVINDEVLHRIERDLDLEEARFG